MTIRSIFRLCEMLGRVSSFVIKSAMFQPRTAVRLQIGAAGVCARALGTKSLEVLETSRVWMLGARASSICLRALGVFARALTLCARALTLCVRASSVCARALGVCVREMAVGRKLLTQRRRDAEGGALARGIGNRESARICANGGLGDGKHARRQGTKGLCAGIERLRTAVGAKH